MRSAMRFDGQEAILYTAQRDTERTVEYRWSTANQMLFVDYHCPAKLAGKREGQRYSASEAEIAIFTDQDWVLTYRKR
jgi:hypothetical protein